MIQETRILMREAIMILLPDMRSQNDIQRSNFFSPAQLVAYFEPLCMLSSHGIDDAGKALIAVKEAMTARQQVSFQPAFAHMLRQHGVEESAISCQELIIIMHLAIPLTIRCFKRIIQTVGQCFIR